MNSNSFNLDAPPSFRGLDPDLPITVYHRHLPHWRQKGATYFVTFRLGDSLPQNKLQFLKRLRDDWEREHRTFLKWGKWNGSGGPVQNLEQPDRL